MRSTCSCVTEEELWGVVDEPQSNSDPALLQHVAACAVCSERLHELGQLRAGLEEIGRGMPPVPERIGPYRVRRVIGHGAGGVVYEAEQGEPARSVALKVLPRRAADARGLRAFRREIRALAYLDHPGIATIHDAGTTDDGQAYFAMQLVDGLPLDAFCERADLSLRARVRLMASIARAVQYAHQRGILHRDLKPQNILIDGNGRAHVLDFGLAQPLNGNGELSLSLSGPAVVGTLPYMSPEQVRGECHDVDVRTDVYSLGVILYRLLTRRAPYDVPSGLEQAVQAIAESAPVHPSLVDRRVPRELGDVVMKSLAKDRERRYASASELAADLECFLAGQAVSARPPSAAYNLRVLARRHKPLVAGVALAFAAVVGGAAMMALGMLEARRQRDETRAVNELLNEALRVGDLRREGSRRLVRDAIDQVAVRLALLSPFDRPSLAEADIQQTIGVAYRNALERHEAMPYLRRALALREALQGDDHPETVTARYELGMCFTFTIPGEREEAGELHGKNRELYEAGKVQSSAALAGSLRELATREWWPGEVVQAPTVAEELYGEALTMARSLPPGRDRAWEEAATLDMMGKYSTELGDRVRFHREALAIRERQGLDNWDVHESLVNTAFTLWDRLGALEPVPEDLEEIRSLRERSVRILRASFGVHEKVVFALRYRGRAELTPDPLAAAGTFAEALIVQRALHDTENPWLVPALLLHQAHALRRAGRNAEASALEAEAGNELAALDDRYADDPAKRVDVRWRLAREAFLLGRPEEQLELSRDPGRIWRDVPGAPDQRLGRSLGHLGLALFGAGSFEEAETKFEEAIDVLRTAAVAPAEVLPLEIALTSARFYAAEPVPSTAELDELLHRARRELRPDEAFQPSWNQILVMNGLAYARQGELERAEALLREAASHTTPLSCGPRGLSRWALARVLWEQGRTTEAWRELREAYWAVSAVSGPWCTALVQCDAARLLAQRGELDRAIDLFERAFPILVDALGPENRFVRDAWEARPR